MNLESVFHKVPLSLNERVWETSVASHPVIYWRLPSGALPQIPGKTLPRATDHSTWVRVCVCDHELRVLASET